MTVSELITILQTQSPDALVVGNAEIGLLREVVEIDSAEGCMLRREAYSSNPSFPSRDVLMVSVAGDIPAIYLGEGLGIVDFLLESEQWENADDGGENDEVG